MPIKISNEKEEEIAWLCGDDWELPIQLKAFEEWLSKDGKNLPNADYYADIGFSPRKDAAGGGCIISLESMKIMLSIGMKLYLSEYPEFVDETELLK